MHGCFTVFHHAAEGVSLCVVVAACDTGVDLIYPSQHSFAVVLDIFRNAVEFVVEEVLES